MEKPLSVSVYWYVQLKEQYKISSQALDRQTVYRNIKQKKKTNDKRNPKTGKITVTIQPPDRSIDTNLKRHAKHP